MARRAEQAARCPWCEASLRRDASECPECLFPFTMAATSSGGRPDAGRARGTTSTASPLPTPVPSSRFHMPGHTSPPVGRAHRMRLASWVLGLTAVILVIAGVASWLTVSSPAGRADRAAQVNLLVALSRAQGTDTKPALPLEPLPATQPSDAPERPSIHSADGLWFAAARSTSGRCYVLAWRLDGTADTLAGTLAKGEPCTGARARERLVKSLESSTRKR